jgi:UDP-2,3-diacylglucosamine hydrolase
MPLTIRDTVYFISDAHLGEHGELIERRKEERLTTFFRHIGDHAACLYVVGDLFDFWFEYRQVIPSGHGRILHELARLVRHGTRVVYLAGNHDFWLGDFFPREIGAEISREPLSIKHQGLSLYVAHGDGLAQRDRGYRLLKRILRNPLNIWLYRLIHPDVGLPLAKLVSASSRAYTDQKALELVSEYERAAREILSRGFDAVILGHSHYPSLRSFGRKIYLNIGDWITHFTYGRLRGGKLTLHVWSAAHSPTV